MTPRCAAEIRHRWVARMGVSLLLLVSLLSVSGQMAAIASPLVDRCRELLAQCALVLHATGAPLQWLPVGLLGVGLAYAVLDQVRLSRRVARFVGVHRRRRPRAGEAILLEAAALQVDAHVRVLVGDVPNPAFTAGTWRPRIYIAESLQHVLSPDELRAVIRHEYHHFVRRDPLRSAMLRFAARTLFWLPLVRVLADELMDDAELMADDFAADPSGGGNPLDVASALVRIRQIGQGCIAVPAGAAGIGGFRALERRVHRLVDPESRKSVRHTTRRVGGHAFLSLTALAVLLAASTFTPRASGNGITMQWDERCHHPAAAAGRHCPECERRATPMHRCPDGATAH